MNDVAILEASASQSAWYVLCRLNSRLFALPTEYTIELLQFQWQDITPLAGSAPIIMGMLNHRGHVIPVVEGRKLMAMESYLDELAELRSFIQAREQDHIDWLEALKLSVETGKKFTKALDPAKCAFGQWYEDVRCSGQSRTQLTNEAIVLESLLDAFDLPHKAIHGIAERVLALSNAGKGAEALEIIQRAWDNELAELKRLFTAFVGEYEAQRVPSLIVVQFEGVRVGFIVDAVHSVLELEQREFAEVPEVAQSQEGLVDSVTRLTDGELISILNMAAILDLLPDRERSAA